MEAFRPQPQMMRHINVETSGRGEGSISPEAKDRLSIFIMSLEDSGRTLFNLRFIEGQSDAEIAKKLGETEDVIRERIRVMGKIINAILSETPIEVH